MCIVSMNTAMPTDINPLNTNKFCAPQVLRSSKFIPYTALP